ncbi:MAG: beta-lactamase family protein [Synergistaceae bacterium]|nr:beta-lactamase family protein [Synergistaceae bacterium]
MATNPVYPIKKLLSFLALFALFASCHAADAAAARTQQPRKTDEGRREFASFIDGFFAGVQRDWQIPGMAFVAVGDGEVMYLKGYGFADVESKRPAEPGKTLFRVGAISTAATATALLQLVEKGRLALDEDVNVYLRKWRLPSTFEAPVTLRHLLTHTGGFDDKKLEMSAPTSADEKNYAARLQKKMPARYAPPGAYYSFSGMSYALVGAIIERYSRQDFAAAIARYVFQPLGMNDSTFAPNPEQMKNLAKGYGPDALPVKYSYFYDMPASSMSATASDMGNFMIAAMGGGAFGRGRVLPPMYANSMLRRHFSPHPLIEGVSLAYREKFVGGLRTLQQSGNIPGYSSFLMLIPEKNFGLFYATNISGLNFSDDLAQAVVGRFFPLSGDVRRGASLNPNTDISPEVAGFYRHNSISRHTAEKAAKLFSDQLKVSLSEGGITISHTSGNSPMSRWKPAARDEKSADVNYDDIFRGVEENGEPSGEYIFFQRDENASIKALVMGSVSNTYDKLSLYESRYRQLAYMVCFVAIFLFSCIGAALGVAINKGKLPWEKSLRSATELWSISVLFCVIQIAFIVGMSLSIYYEGNQFAVFVPYRVKALFIVPLAGGLLLAWFWFRLLANLANPDCHWAEKLILIAMAAAETSYMVFLANWRLLGFMF